MADDIASQLEGAVESLGRFRDSLEDNNIRLGNSASIEAKINKLEADKLKLLEKANKAEGKRMKDLASGMGKATKGMGKLAMKLGVVGGILTMFKGVVDVLLKVDRHAAKFAKQMGMTRDATKRLFQDASSVEGSFTAMGLSLGDALQTAGALAQEFGQVSRVTKDMVVQTGQFAKAFGLGTQEAAQLTEHLTRSGKSMDFINKGLQQAHISGNALGVVARDLTKNAGMIELYLSRGDDSILDMANRAAGLGKSLESFGKMADAWGDVESIGENIGKTAQLLGAEFEDGLGDLTELYKMYQNFQDVDLHQKVTEQLAKTMKLEGDILISRKTGEALTRSQVEQAAKLYGGDTEFMMRSVKAQMEYGEAVKQINSQLEAGKKISAERFEALQSAAREVANESNEFKAGTDLLKIQKSQQLDLLKAAQERLKVREAEADQEADIEKILKSAMGVFEKIMSMVNTIMEPIKTAISTIFDEAFMTDFNKTLEGWGATIEGIFSGKDGGAFDMGRIAAEVNKPEGGLISAFKLLSTQIRTGFLDAFTLKSEDGTTLVGESSTWGDVIKSIIDTYIKPPMREFIDWMGKEVFGALGKGYDKWKQETPWADVLLPDTEAENMRERLAELQAATSDDWMTRMDALGSTWSFDIMGNALGIGTGDALVEIASLKRQLGIESTNALGRIGGGRHRGIVGEAGTEVGITRSALRELSSAGIPGYQSGLGTALTNRSGLTQSAGSVGGRAGRHASSRYEQQRYQNSINNFLRVQDDITRERHEIWARDTKEFFTKYPAIVDEALGAPFREGGPVVTGIYNSVFSGLQASTRAELAGASKSEQRQLMYQHMAAEGLKPGGIISQGMNWLGEKQSQLNKTFGDGIKLEEEKEAELRKTFLKSSEEVSRAYYSGDKKKLKELREINESNYEALQAQKKQVSELRELQKRGDGWNRATVGLLGGIQSGLAMAAGVVASGGSKKQARKAAGTGLVAGLVKDLTGTFGTADKEFLGTFDTIGMLLGTKPMPSNIGGNASDIINRALSQTEQTFQGRGRGLGWGGGNAQGRVYNSPHLAVVGEGSQNEIIVPTERIRKGLPINAGVAKELASIGVPGYFLGGILGPGWGKAEEVGIGGNAPTDKGMVGFGGMHAGGKAFAGGRMGGALHNLKGAAGGGIATAGLSFANTLLQGGDMRTAAAQGIGAGVGYAATAALTPFLGPFAPLAGGLVGNLVGKGLGKLFAKKPKYKRYRNRAVKQLEDHVQSNGMFMWGQPGGVQDNLERAIAGKQRDKPSEKHYNRLKKKMLNSPVLGRSLTSGNIDPFIALMSGQMDTATGNQQYARFNNLFYGTPMAKGGIVTGPTRAIIGEKGPEAVIPLSQHGGYASREQQQDQKDMIGELKKQNQQMQMFIKNMGDAKTVLNVDGRQLAETVGQNMYDINTGI